MSEARIMAYLKEIKAYLEISDLVSEEEAAKALGVKKVSLQNAVYSGKIPAQAYTFNLLGKREYYLSKVKNALNIK